MEIASITLTVLEPDLSAAEECPDCGFDALLTFPLRRIADDGVYDAGAVKVCGRCVNEDGR